MVINGHDFKASIIQYLQTYDSNHDPVFLEEVANIILNKSMYPIDEAVDLTISSIALELYNFEDFEYSMSRHLANDLRKVLPEHFQVKW